MNLLVTGAWNPSDIQIEKIKELGCNLIFLKDEKDKMPCPYDEIEGIICNGLFLHHPIERFTSLKYIQITSAGYDRIPTEYIKEKGIKLFNARGVYSIPMAEYAVGGVLQIYKKSMALWENQKKHKWEKNRDIMELYQKNVLIVGCGSVGDECAKRFSAFGTSVTGVDIINTTKNEYDAIYSMDKLNECLEKSDIVILTLPLTDDTKHLIDEERLTHFKDGAVLVNIARGGIVKTNALVDAIENKLLGAVLDVHETEPLDENSVLWELDNVILTPHNSFIGENNSDRLFDVIYKNLKANQVIEK